MPDGAHAPNPDELRAPGFQAFLYAELDEELVDGYQYEFTPKIPQGGHQRPAAPSGPGNNGKPAGAYQPLTAMPNPARDAVAFYYNLREETAAAILRVYDINGQAVKTFEMEGPKGHIGWNTGSFGRGVYYCKIEQQGKSYPALKLVLMK